MKGALEYDKQDSIESDAIAITEPDDELVVGDNEVTSTDDGFVEVIYGEIEDGTAEDSEMDLPLQYKRWKARMTKQGKAKQADVYLKKIIVLIAKNVRKTWPGKALR